VKNKKLFAILTLVCFMFTLMPVAAFATPVSGDGYVTVKVGTKEKSSVKVNEEFNLSVEEGVDAEFVYIVLDEEGDVEEIFESATANVIKTPGVYEIYAVEADDAEAILDENVLLTKAEKVDLLMDKDSLVDEFALLTVKSVDTDYEITISDVAADDFTDAVGTTNAKLVIDADGGYANATLKAKVTIGDKNVKDADVKFATNGYGVKITKVDSVTDRKGEVKFNVSATVAGNYKIYVTYKDAKEVIDVQVGVVKPADVTTVAEPTAPVDVTTALSASGIGFKLFDANGNVITTTSNLSYGVVGTQNDYKLSVVSKPADSTLTTQDLVGLSYDENYNYWVINAVPGSLSEEGTYTFAVSLPNGSSASASVTVKEFDDEAIAGLKLIYNPATLGLNDFAFPVKLFLVDKNGVQQNLIQRANAASGDLSITGLSGVEIAANGAAVKDFDATTGKVTVKADDKYIGSTINVFAVYQDYTASATLTVVEDATTLAFNKTTADVAVTNTLVADVVDSEGNKVDLNGTIVGNPQVIVLEKPENALVAASAVAVTDAADKVNVTFTASAAGEYKIQVIVKYTELVGGETVNRYISAIETITVGGTAGQFEDVVVMSIGANKVVVNSDVKDLVAAPMIKDQRTFVPFRALAEAFGANVEWVEATQSVVAELNGVKVVMVIGEEAYTVNGVAKTADVAPFINGASTMVPVRFVAEAFGITVTPIYAEDGTVADVLFAK